MQTTELEIIFSLIGGLGLFMYAITLLRETLGKISGKRVAKILEKTTDSPVRGMGVGTATTFMTQSSSITVLTLIGFVNAGIMTFRQSVNVMLGSEIGTTLTAQLVSFKIESQFYWLLIAIGFFVPMFWKDEKVQLTGKVIFSLGLLFLAMDFMKAGARPLATDYPFFRDLINDYGAIPIVGILIGAFIAGVTQSSSATTSLVIAMGMSGVIDLSPAIALVMGANIGTTFLEIFAAIGATTPAKRTALAQALINVLGVLMFLPILGPFTSLIVSTDVDLARQIANAHTIFNVLVSLIFVPLVGVLVRFCERIIPDKEGEKIGQHMFDDEMLHMPQVALLEAENEIIRTAEITVEMIDLSRDALLQRNLESAKRVLQLEDEVDDSCRATETFIDKIREEELNQQDTIWRFKLLHILTDIERVGDLTTNMAEFAVELTEKKIDFSETAQTDLEQIFDLVAETYITAVNAMTTKNKDLARAAEQLEDDIDQLERALKEAHVRRVAKGICRPEADTFFVETLRNLERIGDHADNIALDIIMERY
ncbi:MAG: Na/Pi cotransporter family protein [Candidatus Thorarchaeota archaeon]|nr:MAG: Na/Pi cotransporter family protein [Candidatus Thorarchaeota archaeon]